uniref:Uncharacterized protein n=1 Tax=Megaviridae environmental sample TaxID=1737588 RepID=A0A5J6VJZ5_9VIRU|nr:MAG: hypothetical protein [Megaviridae environmental sample]
MSFYPTDMELYNDTSTCSNHRCFLHKIGNCDSCKKRFCYKCVVHYSNKIKCHDCFDENTPFIDYTYTFQQYHYEIKLKLAQIETDNQMSMWYEDDETGYPNLKAIVSSQKNRSRNKKHEVTYYRMLRKNKQKYCKARTSEQHNALRRSIRDDKQYGVCPRKNKTYFL